MTCISRHTPHENQTCPICIMKQGANPTLLILHEQFTTSLQTPTSIYLCLQSNYSFLLESAQLTHLSQYSLMGTGHTVIENTSTIEDTYSIISNSPLHFITHVGYLSYDLIEQYHNIPYPKKEATGIFDLVHSNIHKSQWIIPTYYCVYDHVHHLVHVHKIIILNDLSNLSAVQQEHQSDLSRVSTLIKNSINIYTNIPISIPHSNGQIKQTHFNMSESEYKQGVVDIKHHIHEGDIFQCVYARQILLEVDNLNEFQVYMTLRQMNPSPYMYYMEFDSVSIVGASPELLCKMDPISSEVIENEEINKMLIYSHPIAGTRKRGANSIEDEVLAADLLADTKECAEHVMLVDLARNDVGRVVLPHPTHEHEELVAVSKFMEIQYFSHVMHIVSEVQGISYISHPVANEIKNIPKGFTHTNAHVSDSFDVIRGLFPAGTLSGAPKHKAMQLINHFEPHPRSIYGGLVGLINGRGGMDTAIVIRTIIFLTINNQRVALIQAGAGIVADSDPTMEYQETVNKMGSCVQAIKMCCNLPLNAIINNLPSHHLTMVKIHKSPELANIANYPHLTPFLNNPVLLIDNYDSFTFNIYHFIHKSVFVVRNDQISLAQIHKLKPSHIIISPGPGFPKDSGISPLVIKEFKSQIPILGICLGHQLLCELFDGQCDYAPYLMHGKTSLITHTGQGIYKGIPSPMRIMRYHSLLGTINKNSGLISTAVTEDNLLMSVQHNKCHIYGVQYHPESIKSEHGKLMIQNFIDIKYAHKSTSQIEKRSQINKESILSTIVSRTSDDVNLRSSTPGSTMTDLLDMLPYCAPTRALTTSNFHIFAEFKRASPSKGTINNKSSIIHYAQQYELSGASVISILTEPHYFKGLLVNMAQVKLATNKILILRKDFIISKYQILESRICGADIILLICSILTRDELSEFINYAHELGLQTLVEVYTKEEAEMVNTLPCQLIGINNRNLHDFTVNKDHVLEIKKILLNKQVIALSGINTPEDAIYYKQSGCDGVLIGEALMRSENVGEFIRGIDKKGVEASSNKVDYIKPLVKICGITTIKQYQASIGVSMVGFMFVTASSRFVTPEAVKTIINKKTEMDKALIIKLQHARRVEDPLERVNAMKQISQLLKRPFVIGVFMDQGLKEIQDIISKCDLDMVQLHGNESCDLIDLLSVPVIKAVRNETEIHKYEDSCHNKPLLYLLDGIEGGSGEKLDWGILPKMPFMLAGGINSGNVKEALDLDNCIGVDCSSGLEIEKGEKDLGKIKEFVDKFK